MTPPPLPKFHLTTVLGKTEKVLSSISAVDVFCGIGGLTHGLLQSGIGVNAGIDIDKTCRYAFEQNNEAQFIAEDIRDISSSALERQFTRTFARRTGCCKLET